MPVALAVDIGSTFTKLTLNLREKIQQLHEHVAAIPNGDEERALDMALARVAVELAVWRHAGRLERFLTPDGEMYVHRGKDLTQVTQCIGTGGPIVHAENPEAILQIPSGCFPKSSVFTLTAAISCMPWGF